jgi:hypothetical protein
LYYGINIGWNEDTPRLTSVSFTSSSHLSASTSLQQWVWDTATAYIIFTSGSSLADGPIFTDCLAYGYNTGFLVGHSGTYTPNGVSFIRCGGDACKNPFYMRGNDVTLINCNATATLPPGLSGTPNHAIVCTGGILRCFGAHIWGSSAGGIYLDGTGSVAYDTKVHNSIIQGCIINGYGGAGTPAVAGICLVDNYSEVVVQGNHISGSGATNVIGIGVYSAGYTVEQNVIIDGNVIVSTDLAGIYLGLGVSKITCTNNVLSSTAGLTDALGAVAKNINGNVIEGVAQPATMYGLNVVQPGTTWGNGVRLTSGAHYWDLVQGADNNLYINYDAAASSKIAVTSTGNLSMGLATFGTSAEKTLGITTGVAPATAPADAVQLYCKDINGAAGKAGLHMMAESGTANLIVAGVIIKTDTGDPAQVHEGLICINTQDNTVKIYAEAGWRTVVATW